MKPAIRRRILDELKIEEISGVDSPCQEDARVTIMKRRHTMQREETQTVHDEELEGALTDLDARVTHLTQKLDSGSFDSKVAEIRKREGCTGTVAMAKARRQCPDLFEATFSPPISDYDELVAAEIRKGCSPNVAAQRAALRCPEAAAQAIERAKISKSSNDFMTEVNRTMIAKNLTRTAAMTDVRRYQPELFAAFQET